MPTIQPSRREALQNDHFRVLHVDDDSDFAELAAKFIQREDDRLVVDVAFTAHDALERLSEDDVDCVISDYEMPDMDGIDFLEAVRDAHPELPFILFTGKGSEEVASEAISAGVTEYMQKEGGTDQYAVLANRVTVACERYLSQLQLHQMTELYETMLETMTEVVLVTDPSGEFTYICPNVEHIFGYTVDEVAELETVNAFLREPRIDESGIETDGPVRNVEGSITDKAGEERTVLLTVRPISSPAHEGTTLYTIRDISDRKAQEVQLERAEAKYRSFTEDALDTSAVGTFILDSSFTVVWINRTIEEYFGIDRRSVVGQDERELIEAEIASIFESSDRFAETVLATYDDNSYVEEFDCHVLPAEGREERWLRHWSQPIASGLYAGGRIEHYTDITESKRRERELESLTREYERVFETAQEAIFLIDVHREDGDYVFRYRRLNPAAASITGLATEDLLGRTPVEVFGEEVGASIQATYRRCAETGGPISYDRIIELPAGTLHLKVNLGPVRSRGEVTQLVGIARDVTAERARLEELQRERDRFEAVFDKATDAMVIADDDGRYVDANAQATELFGLPYEELLDRSIPEFAPEDFDFQAAWEQFLTGDDERGVFPLVRPDGERRIVEYAASAEIADGRHLSVLRDVTERQREQEQLQQTSARLEALYENSPDMIDVLDPEGTILDVNQRFCDELGYTADEVLGRPIWEVDVDVTAEGVQRLLADFELHERRKFEGRYERRDGTVFPIEVHLLRLNIDGEDRFLAISRDITERKRRERSLVRQNERLQEFASIVSHDLRNPLNVADGRLALARKTCSSEDLDAVATALERMEDLIDDLLMLARQGEQVSRMEAVDLTALARTCWQNVATAEAKLEVADAPVVQADRSRVQQVLENLVRNAVEHGGESVTVTIGETDTGFHVEDDGPGIPEDEWEAVLQPGYSTSSDGTGFGLTIVRQIAAAHGWTVTVGSSAAGGARFEFSGVEK